MIIHAVYLHAISWTCAGVGNAVILVQPKPATIVNSFCSNTDRSRVCSLIWLEKNTCSTGVPTSRGRSSSTRMRSTLRIKLKLEGVYVNKCAYLLAMMGHRCDTLSNVRGCSSRVALECEDGIEGHHGTSNIYHSVSPKQRFQQVVLEMDFKAFSRVCKLSSNRQDSIIAAHLIGSRIYGYADSQPCVLLTNTKCYNVIEQSVTSRGEGYFPA